MNPNWVKVFHVTDNQGIVGCIPHHLILDFLETCDGALNQTLGNWRQFETIFGDFPQFFLIGTHTATSTTQGKGWTDNDGVADRLGKYHRFFYGSDNF